MSQIGELTKCMYALQNNRLQLKLLLIIGASAEKITECHNKETQLMSELLGLLTEIRDNASKGNDTDLTLPFILQFYAFIESLEADRANVIELLTMQKEQLKLKIETVETKISEKLNQN